MIEIKNVSKTFDGKTHVVESLNLTIKKGELMVLIGESGCGKTTTMKMINRLIDPSEGTIFIDGENTSRINKNELRRRIGYVIQKVGLFPHLTIGENIELLPTLSKWKKEKKRERAYELMEMVDLPPEEYYSRYPSQLSGGQQQRVGVARALAMDPDIILMDEPFSALDPITREQLQQEILNLQDELHKTIVFVTHDMDEAIKLGDRIAVMKDGNIIQCDTPEEILKNPVDDFIEYFVGKDRLWRTPEMLYAKDIASKKLIRIGANRSAAHAIEVMKEKNINALVVVDKDSNNPQKPRGIVGITQLRKANSHEIKMKDIMKKRMHFVYEDTNLVEVLNLRKEHKLRNIPVLDGRENVTGIITETSILNILTDVVPGLDD